MLFTPIKVGDCELLNRVVFAPLTRFRNIDTVPTQNQVSYYAQRAHSPGTLLISEATMISEISGGYFNHPALPGIWSKLQIEGWRKVSEAVHAAQGFLYIQLWDLGRQADYDTITGLGHDRVSASDVSEDGKPVRSLTTLEVEERVKWYAQAAKNSIEAEADGVEIHSANGYLPDQFLRWNTNQRTDKYGGSVENRARFTLEIVEAVCEAVGASKVGIRLSPWTEFGGMAVDEKLSKPQFEYVIRQLQDRFPNLAYVHVIEGRTDGHTDLSVLPEWKSNDWITDIWKGPLIRAGGYTTEGAIEEAAKNDKTLIAIGRNFSSNPDLVDRMKTGKKLTPYDRATFYTPGPEGYCDWPVADVE